MHDFWEKGFYNHSGFSDPLMICCFKELKFALERIFINLTLYVLITDLFEVLERLFRECHPSIDTKVALFGLLGCGSLGTAP